MLRFTKLIEILKTTELFIENEAFKFFFNPVSKDGTSRFDILYTTIIKLSQIQNKSLTDPQFYKQVIKFIQAAIQSSNVGLEENDGPTKLLSKSDDLIDISIVDDIFGIAQGNLDCACSLAKKILPEQE